MSSTPPEYPRWQNPPTPSAEPVQPPTCRPSDIALPRSHWVLLALASFVPRAYLAFVGGPFIDEACYSIVIRMPPMLNLTGAQYLWPPISWLLHEIGSLPAARMGAAAFHILTVFSLYRITHFFAQRLAPDAASVLPWTAALLYSALPCTLIAGAFATYDSMAFAFYAAGFSLLTSALARGSVILSFCAGVLAALGFITRYMVLLYLPVFWSLALYFPLVEGQKSTSRTPWRRFYPLLGATAGILLAGGGYFLLDSQHVVEAIRIAHETAYRHAPAPRPVLALQKAATFLTLPFVSAAALGVALAVAKAIRMRSVKTLMHTLYLAGATLLLVLYHMYSGHVFQIEKGLALSGLYAAVLAANGLWPILKCFGWKASERRIALACGAVFLFLHAQSGLDLFWNRWPDVRPLIRRAAALCDRDAGPIWCTDGTVQWAATRAFYPRVDHAPPWWVPGIGPHLLRLASQRRIPYVLGPLEQAQLAPGQIYKGYRVAAVVPVGNPGRWLGFQRMYVFVYFPDTTPSIGPLLPRARNGPRSTYVIPAAALRRAPSRLRGLAAFTQTGRSLVGEIRGIRLAHLQTARGQGDASSVAAPLFGENVLTKPGPVVRVDGTPYVQFQRTFGYSGKADLLLDIEWDLARPRLSALRTRTLHVRFHRYRGPLLLADNAVRPGETLALRVRQANPGQLYQLLASFGLKVQEDPGERLFLAEDALLAASIFGGPPVFVGFRGTVDARGWADAVLNLPSVRGLAGRRLFFAALFFSAESLVIERSNVVSVHIVP